MTLALTDEQIERRVERMMDDMDRRLLAGLLSQTAYDKEVKDLDRWAQAHYAAADAARV